MNFKRYKDLTSYDVNEQQNLNEFMRMRARLLKYASAAYIAGDEPDLIIITNLGNMLFPMWMMQQIDISNSQDILEFRSDGNIFMAQQEGGHHGVRIRFRILDNYIGLMMIASLRYLRWLGQEKDEEFDAEMDNFDIESNVSGNIRRHGLFAPSSLTQGVSLGSLYGYQNNAFQFYSKLPALPSRFLPTTFSRPGSNPSFDLSKGTSVDIHGDKVLNSDTAENLHDQAYKNQNVDLTTPEDFSARKTVFRRTFTLATKYELMFDMYIETMLERRVQVNGINVIDVTLNLRKWTKPPILEDSELVGQYIRNSDDGNVVKSPDSIVRKNTFKNPIIGRLDDSMKNQILGGLGALAGTTIAATAARGESINKKIEEVGFIYAMFRYAQDKNVDLETPDILDVMFNTIWRTTIMLVSDASGIQAKRHKSISRFTLGGF